MPKRETDLLVEQALSAWRPRDPDGTLRPHPAWADLDPDSRARLFEEAAISRRLEAALDPEGLSTTARAVMARTR